MIANLRRVSEVQARLPAIRSSRIEGLEGSNYADYADRRWGRQHALRLGRQRSAPGRGAGNDYIEGGDGADTISGGEGLDWLLGNAGGTCSAWITRLRAGSVDTLADFSAAEGTGSRWRRARSGFPPIAEMPRAPGGTPTLKSERVQARYLRHDDGAPDRLRSGERCDLLRCRRLWRQGAGAVRQGGGRHRAHRRPLPALHPLRFAPARGG